ncbi:MAG TPA: aminoglycoside phosphotransferase family protein [Pilimelia sp.]|nr:aminoglycoside phosphotransferase family protein [Pilimelia sp.]
MGDPDSRTAQPATGVEALVRLRMMGVHVPHQARGGRAGGGTRPSRSTLHRLLAELGLLRGEISDVHWYTARRPVARVGFTGAEPLVLKWLDGTELETDNEVWALTLLDGLPLPPGLRSALPRLLGTTADGGVQAFAHIGDSVTWAQQAAAGAAPDAGTAFDALGACLADLHALPVREHAARHPDRHVRFPIPSMTRLTPREYALGYGTDFAEYAAVMQAIDADLAGLRDSWAPSAYIHFDLRDDNVLFGAAHPAVWIIDWELAGFGDPGYDVGTVAGQMLCHRIPALRVNDSGALTDALAATGRFLRAYQERSGATEEAILRALRFAGVFLLLNALGRLEKVGSLGRVGHLYLLIGRQLVQRPEVCRAALPGRRGAA